MAKPEKTLPPVRPSAAAAARYDAKLQVLIKAMAESVLYWLSATYKANPPVMTEMAGDELPATELKRAVRELSKRWQRRFDEAAPALAEYYTKAAHLRSKTELKRILRNAGISVEFKMTRAMRDVMHASVAEQVSLIKSIPQKYFTDVEGAVMRAATAGRDLHALTKEIGNKVDLSRIKMGRKPGESDKSLAARTARRAAFIARDQVSKMQASFNRVRLVEIGVTECVWQHSGLDRDPRESHRAASKRQQKFDVAKGWLDPEVGRLIQPGELPNCKCFAKPVIPGF